MQDDNMSLSVFVIDDSDVDSFLIEKVLRKTNLFDTITLYNDSKTAMDFILDKGNKNDLPDLILLDVSMPIIDGFEFIDEIEEMMDDDFSPTIFILSNSIERRDRENFDKQRLATEFIVKPLEEEVFLEKVNKHLLS
ncbi:hypothetical protein DNU06_04250 [Putridiphycobacter roseus]|uniref:Response regulatory domain-containing protein n=1 Tax=Putridiphycobacter roseus TaxID=2219161 RepID=A0A2W1NIR1_9FLAO|nr:response regulator [Putridiphycobacter roseus]PZE17836.1 hypothetical protein DNU06_04250 [Putridiphycobacter roseus]